MSQNKFMHPRNIYKKPPSFKEMAINYPEFRRFVKPDLSGKITLDFKDPAALRALTCTLLEKDFGLNVDIPLTRLIPTLPLRLNYLLWIEDILDASGIQRSDYSSVRGIDIGTGASCIYPLLAAKQNNWHMIATEIDAESFETAQRNVNNNHLEHMITIKLVEGDSLLTDVLNNKFYTFTMCNPPFFSSEEDLDFTTKSRSSSRPPPRNGITGDLKELVAPGGEVSFILKMMEESKELRSKIRIYTTMVGHKSSLPVLKLELKKLNVTSTTETRFCQGNTTRWGLAWTFDKSLSLQKAYQTPNQKKINALMSYVIPKNAVEDEKMYNVETITQRITDTLEALEMQHAFKKKNKYMVALDIKAYTNTWSHQRFKKRLQGTIHKKAVGSINTDVHTENEDKDNENLKDKCVNMKRHNDMPGDEICCKKKKEEDSFCSLVSNSKNSVTSEISVESICTPNVSNLNCPDGEVQEKNANEEEQRNVITRVQPNKHTLHVPLLEATLFIRSIASEIHVELLWSGGSGGRESMHQVLQYIKNKLK